MEINLKSSELEISHWETPHWSFSLQCKGTECFVSSENIQRNAFFVHISLQLHVFPSEFPTPLSNLPILRHKEHLTARHLFLKPSSLQCNRGKGSICLGHERTQARVSFITKQHSLRRTNGRAEALRVAAGRQQRCSLHLMLRNY